MSGWKDKLADLGSIAKDKLNKGLEQANKMGLLGRTFEVQGRAYRSKKLLGEGGFGYVFLVQSESGSVHALKQLNIAAKDQLDQAKHEISLWESLPTHKNIVKLQGHSVGRDPKTGNTEVLMLMEFCAGGGLVDMVRERGRLPENEVIAIFSQICEAVEVLHNRPQPIAHRDLKLENVWLADYGNYKLGDFGSATTRTYKCENERDRSYAEADIQKNTTMEYRAPEMCDLFRKDLINEKVDIWALGVTLFRLMFQNQSPFEEGSSLGILNGAYQIPENSKYSEGLHDLIRVCLTQDPAKRPDIVEVLGKIDKLKGGNGAQRTRVQASQPTPNPTPTSFTPAATSNNPGKLSALLDWNDVGSSASTPAFSSSTPSPAPSARSTPPPQTAQKDLFDFGDFTDHTGSTSPSQPVAPVVAAKKQDDFLFDDFQSHTSAPATPDFAAPRTTQPSNNDFFAAFDSTSSSKPATSQPTTSTPSPQQTHQSLLLQQISALSMGSNNSPQTSPSLTHTQPKPNYTAMSSMGSPLNQPMGQPTMGQPMGQPRPAYSSPQPQYPGYGGAQTNFGFGFPQSTVPQQPAYGNTGYNSVAPVQMTPFVSASTPAQPNISVPMTGFVGASPATPPPTAAPTANISLDDLFGTSSTPAPSQQPTPQRQPQQIPQDDFFDFMGAPSTPQPAPSSSTALPPPSSTSRSAPAPAPVESITLKTPAKPKTPTSSSSPAAARVNTGLSAEAKLQNTELNKQHQARLKKLLQEPDNRYCADCGRVDPTWASINLGVFLCLNCSGIHRSIGTHITKVRSVTLDTWTPEQVEFMESMGNARARQIWEAKVPSDFKRPTEHDSQNTVKKWIVAKYEDKEYYRAPSATPAPASSNTSSPSSSTVTVFDLLG